MGKALAYLIAALITLLTVAIAVRIKPIRQIVFGPLMHPLAAVK